LICSELNQELVSMTPVAGIIDEVYERPFVVRHVSMSLSLHGLLSEDFHLLHDKLTSVMLNVSQLQYSADYFLFWAKIEWLQIRFDGFVNALAARGIGGSISEASAPSARSGAQSGSDGAEPISGTGIAIAPISPLQSLSPRITDESPTEARDAIPSETIPSEHQIAAEQMQPPPTATGDSSQEVPGGSARSAPGSSSPPAPESSSQEAPGSSSQEAPGSVFLLTVLVSKADLTPQLQQFQNEITAMAHKLNVGIEAVDKLLIRL
jgi:hypothetical protein